MTSPADREMAAALMRDLHKAARRVCELLDESMALDTKNTALTIRVRELEADLAVLAHAYLHDTRPPEDVLQRATSLLNGKGATIAGLPVIMDTAAPDGAVVATMNGEVVGAVTDVTFTPEDD